MVETLAEAIANFFVFILGACIGSFLNVVVYRLPAGLSLLWPPSRCPHCGHRLGKQENIPILGWLWLRGRCRWCKALISPRYPLVEAITALLFLLVLVLRSEFDRAGILDFDCLAVGVSPDRS